MSAMSEEGLQIQCKSNKLFSAFFSKQIISTEILHYQDDTDNSSATAIMSLLRLEALNLKSPFKIYATQFVIQAIESLVDEHTKINGTFLYSIMSKLAMKGELNLTSIHNRVNHFPLLIKTQVIVELDKIGVISIISYFQTSSECSSKRLEWLNQLFALVLAPRQNPKSQEHDMLDYLLTSIIHVGFGELPAELKETINGQTIKFAVSLLNDLTKQIWDFLWEFSGKDLHAFEFPNEGLHFQLSAFQNCYLEQLAFLITYKPEIKPITAIKSQHEWTFFKSPKNVINFILKLLIPLEVGTVLEKIDEILNRYEINWKNLLLIVSSVQVCYPTANKHLKALVNSFVQRALDNFQMELLLASFLLARQINAENISIPHYGSWFSSITSSSTTSKQFAFLLKFLTNIARHEPAWVLLAHKNNPPFIPMVDNCRTIWTDYTILIRTRMEDLKIKQSSDQVVEEDTNLVKEVDIAISAFGKSDRRNRRIPSSVIEAAIFRKPYFINKFLPVLLKPRRVPDPFDIREEFIEELKKSGKLPLVQYEAYCTACRKLQQSFPEAELMDWQAPEGKPSYWILMNQIVLCNEARQQSLLIEQLDNILESLLPPLETSISVIKFDPDSYEMKTRNDTALKIAECWIDSLKSTDLTKKQPEWLNRYFLLFSRYPSFIESLYCLVWEFTHKCKGNDIMIRSYGIIIYLLSHNSNVLLPVHYQSFDGPFILLLMDEDQLAMNKEDSILFHFRLLYYTVAEAKLQNQLDSVRLPFSLYLWLSRRILHSHITPQYKKYHLEDVEFRKESKLPLRKWLKLEITVEADRDVLSLSERPGYLHSVLQMDYQDFSVTELYPIILDSIIESSNPTGRANCSKDLLFLLQSLLCNDQRTSSSDSSAWLIQYWLELRRNQGNGVDQVLWSLVCCLPPYLLSRNYYSQHIREPSLKTLVNLIEDDWRNTLTSDRPWFPKFITSHLLRALEGTSSQDIPCLQFSAQIHAVHDAKVVSGPWRSLDKALDTFHPLRYDPQNAETIQWIGLIEVDLLACQLMALSAVIECAKGTTDELPLFLKKLGSDISRNPSLLQAWKITFWSGDDCILPWKKIIPTYMLNLLPFVLLRSLISWSDVLLLTVSDYLDALITAHNQWNQTIHSYFDLVNAHESQIYANYPVGNILDLYTLGRLSSDIKQILKRAPLHFLKTLQRSHCFRSMETDNQEIVTQRYS